ncbi:2-succinyl-5-enolpyruvyl-6-hydroxy-3-cyclohexene-1-carboxylic-acid synthase [Halomicrobium sp. LC1Hm]|uniref:2-succinyl-5-enolpyruvyl-6-hydroxy-3- cyclohexene-1-carboxylic-acid synthase n=1 Tax=Halomicrobium sp. LC1Hm TaxID=2610902 RepID=UPI00129853FA|nr:2-succinyl-5-enolpyruvyl-6-hydroxy-3-cyclohexene-1-carboxylic-acid synthase [Halomicrobium sp. LC1Hm]QGA82853.1 2-succinyl-5-enolpyruvyl-6-hydroxy-3-cyclohexene -1-carboxylate synthase [Halomicrobium sp. LC1Hm]
MTEPNENTLWGRVIVEELVANGIDAVCVAPGSRSTPLTVAVAQHPEIRVYSHLDERSAAYFALGRARRTGTPTPLICTSGTAAANFHPAVIEADQSRVPMVLLTADRPRELQDSGANQTIDQEKLYGDAVRQYRSLPEPAPEPRRLRSLRTTLSRAVATATDTPAGPVHLNVPVSKPLEPTPVEGAVPDDLPERAPVGANGRGGPMVRTTRGDRTLSASELSALADRLDRERGLIVAGPSNGPTPDRDALAALVDATGFPVLADPLSGHRFGPHVVDRPICGGYDSYLDAGEWPDPDIVLRFGASPTSKTLRHWLGDADAAQFVVDPAGQWSEATFTATDLVVADPTGLATGLAERLDRPATAWTERFETAEARYWDLAERAHDEQFFEGTVAATVASAVPDPATVMVSNSMPVRDLDRFGRPRAADVTVLGNRGASGIDGITSTGLGAGSATDDPLVVLTGDLAYYHDMNGLLAVGRCDVDATIVLVNNDGGGIFHELSIESFEPPFTDQFRTPHGLDFEPTGALYDLEYDRVEGRGALADAVASSAGASGTQIVECRFDSERSHRYRDRVHERVRESL